MPLIKRSSKKAFEKNIKTEMKANPGKDKRKQNIAIAYSVQREAKKKKKAAGGTVVSGSKDMNMAKGGEVNAKNQRRPMPNDIYNDTTDVSENLHQKQPFDDSWTDNSTVTQAQSHDTRGKRLPIKMPRMVPTDAFSTRLYDKEGNLMESMRPGPYGEQPESDMNELDAKKSGHTVRDMEDEHSTHKKPYRQETEDDDTQDQSESDMRKSKMADGGEVEESDYEHKENKYEDSHLPELTPSEEEGREYVDEHDEKSQNLQGDEISDMEDEHSTGRKPYSGGGRVGDTEENIDSDVDGEEPATKSYSSYDSEDQPLDEEEDERHSSIAAAIMARRQKMHHEIDSGAYDMDNAVTMASGGEILSHGSMDSDDFDQADLSRNHDEDANEEDQASFDALRKENYNNSDLNTENPNNSDEIGDSEEKDSEDKHDMISTIRKKMKSKRQF